MNSNPIQFKKPALPIVGQPFTLKSWFLTISIVCNCEAKEPVLLIGNAIGTCQACGRRWQQQGMKAAPNGEIAFAIGFVIDNEQTGAQPS